MMYNAYNLGATSPPSRARMFLEWATDWVPLGRDDYRRHRRAVADPLWTPYTRSSTGSSNTGHSVSKPPHSKLLQDIALLPTTLQPSEVRRVIVPTALTVVFSVRTCTSSTTALVWPALGQSGCTTTPPIPSSPVRRQGLTSWTLCTTHSASFNLSTPPHRHPLLNLTPRYGPYAPPSLLYPLHNLIRAQ